MKAQIFLTAAVVLLVSCSAPSKEPAKPLVTPVGTTFGPMASSEIGPAGGTVKSSDGLLTLTFPANAVDKATMISVQSISPEAPGAVRAWRLGPEGTTFKQPVQLAMNYGEGDVTGSAPEALEIAYQTANGVWGVLKQFSLDTAGKKLTATTTHFSDWSLLQGLQLLPKDAKVLVGESVTLTVNNCALVDTGDEVISLRALCEPEELLLRTADWSVNGKVGGTTTVGTVTGRETGVGTFEAPMKKPSPSLVTVSTVFTASGRKGVKGLLVSNITVVDVKGWSGNITYVIDGSKTTDEKTTQGQSTSDKHTVWTRAGSGAIRFEPGAFDGTLKVAAGSASWNESWEETIVNTNPEGNCPRVTTRVHETHYSGTASDPVTPNAIHLLSITGDKYRLELSSLQGLTTGTERVKESGTVMGGAGCSPPVNSDVTTPSNSSIPVQIMVVEGTIDPMTPNVIKGLSKVVYGDQLPKDAFTISWQFEK